MDSAYLFDWARRQMDPPATAAARELLGVLNATERALAAARAFWESTDDRPIGLNGQGDLWDELCAAMEGLPWAP